MDYFTPFTYFFHDKAWLKKFFLASLLTFTLIGAAPVIGWTVEIARRVSRGEEPPVPELSDWKTFWRLGGQFALVNVFWLLPIFLAVCLLYLPLIIARSLRPEAILAVFAVSLTCVLLFLVVYSVIYVFLLPSMMVLLVTTGLTQQAAHPLRLWRVARAHFIEHLVVFLLVGVVLLNLVFLIAPFTLFLLLPSMLVYTALVSAHFAGQLARLHRNQVQPAGSLYQR